jgi:uncharacterized protein (TIGR00299 family) protein
VIGMTSLAKIQAITAVHLDAVGGVAGDMFAAALLDAMPELWPACEQAVAAIGLPPGAGMALSAHSDGVLTGTRFAVNGPAPSDRHHTHWRDIRDRIQTAPLAPGVAQAALGIFGALAEAEAAIHGVEVDEVAFHEVGAWDSITDVITAAALIDALGECRWSVGVLPRGRGLVSTQHGHLPVPAPATLALLKGFTLFDDGEEGERITPTGAAILNYLAPEQGPDPVPRRLITSGLGFGTRKLAARANFLRATLYGPTAEIPMDAVEVLRFEVDDQSGEDLAAGLDHLRALEGVLDVCQWPVMGKKGRMGAAVQILVRPDAADRVVTAALDETTTLGVRRQPMTRSILPRESREAHGKRVKLARRPGQVTAKVEMDELTPIRGAGARGTARSKAEEEALREGHE